MAVATALHALVSFPPGLLDDVGDWLIDTLLVMGLAIGARGALTVALDLPAISIATGSRAGQGLPRPFSYDKMCMPRPPVDGNGQMPVAGRLNGSQWPFPVAGWANKDVAEGKRGRKRGEEDGRTGGKSCSPVLYLERVKTSLTSLSKLV